MSHAAAAWPIVGFVIALLPAALLFVLGQAGANGILASALALALFAILTGGLHEDGLADVADGLIGGAQRQAKLAIMKDSQIGTFGTLALVFSVLIKVGALTALLAESSVLAALAFALSALLSRSMALWHWHALLPAKQSGLSHRSGRPDNQAFLIGSLSGFVAGLILLAIFGLAAIISIILAFISVSYFSRICRRQIGGQTGDTIGATQQIGDLTLLAGLALFFSF